MRILVVGAGPVGLALVLALHRRGIAARQVDRAPEPSRHSKALGIQARTLEALDALGVAAPVLAEALRIEGPTFHLGGAPRGFDLTHRLHPRFPSMVILPQSRTEALLAAALAAAGAAPPERGVELVALDGTTGAVALRHPDGRVEEAAFDQVIGADGAHSVVRKAAGIGFEGSRYEEPLVLADGRAEGLEPARLHIFPGTGRGHFFFPLPDGSWRAVAMLPEESRPPPEGDLSAFQLPGVRFSDPVWWSAFRISHRLASAYRAGRACVLGDAAHIHSPAGGQGMNLGIQDACSLAEALPRGEAALAEWAASRRAVAATVLRRTDLLTGMILGKRRALRALRAVALRAVPHLPPLARRFERALSGLDYPSIA
jgi:2-polyprenyl-6-methoxyphenol hydroxylase-like FAD-dependent oxidoreductase